MGRPKLYSTDHPNLRATTPRKRPTTVYYGDFRIGGRRHRPKLGTDKNSALALLRTLMDREKEQEAGPDHTGPYRLSEAQALHLQHHRQRIRKSTFGRYKSNDRNAVKGLGDPFLAELTDQQIADWVAKRAAETSTTTANRDLTRLKQVLSWAVRRQWIPRNPADNVRKFREVPGRLRWLSKEEETRLKEVADPNAFRMMRFAWLTGLRQHEQLGLRWDQIVNDQIHLNAKETKGHKFRAVPISKAVAAILEEQRGKHEELVWPTPTGKQYDRRNFSRWVWEPAFAAAELEDFVWHDFRHTFCSRLVQAGVSLVAVNKLAGHSTFEETMRYAHFAPDHLRESVEVLE